ncbi:MAG TPA: hypothetical protein ENI68_09885 [Gammaproteobacteria bacterium]|nr:hypothetical protein [Gammaproteobacteria bacterium]
MQVARLATDPVFDLPESLLYRIVQVASFGKLIAQGVNPVAQASQLLGSGLTIRFTKLAGLRAACK